MKTPINQQNKSKDDLIDQAESELLLSFVNKINRNSKIRSALLRAIEKQNQPLALSKKP